jgi:hypothetical protein
MRDVLVKDVVRAVHSQIIVLEQLGYKIDISDVNYDSKEEKITFDIKVQPPCREFIKIMIHPCKTVEVLDYHLE